MTPTPAPTNNRSWRIVDVICVDRRPNTATRRGLAARDPPCRCAPRRRRVAPPTTTGRPATNPNDGMGQSRRRHLHTSPKNRLPPPVKCRNAAPAPLRYVRPAGQAPVHRGVVAAGLTAARVTPRQPGPLHGLSCRAAKHIREQPPGMPRACGPSPRHAPCMLPRRPRHAARSLAQQAALCSVTQGRHSGTSLEAAARASGSAGPRGENWLGPHPAPMRVGASRRVRRHRPGLPVNLRNIHGQKIQWEGQSISQIN
jgi:hypothetical protein